MRPELITVRCSVEKCEQCAGSHEVLVRPLHLPVTSVDPEDPFVFWSTCPTFNVPLLFTSRSAPDPVRVIDRLMMRPT